MRSPADEEAWLLLGKAAEAAGDDQAAAAAWSETLRIDPGNTEAQVRQADFYRRTGRVAEARKAAADVSSWSRDAEAAFQLAVHYARSNERGRALEQAALAVRSRPDDTTLLKEAARLQAWLGDREAAVATLERLLVVSPGRHDARLNAGALLREMGRGNPGYLDSLGWAHYRRGDTQEAIAEFGQALEKRPDDALIREHLAEVCRSLEDPGGAPQCREPATAPPSPAAPSSAP